MPENPDVALADAEPNADIPAAATPTQIPGRTLGIVGFVLSLLALANVVGLVLSIIALAKSRRAGHGNGFAVAGIVIASVGVAITVIVSALFVSTLVDAAQTCARLGDGVHQIGQATYTCTPTSFNVHTRF